MFTNRVLNCIIVITDLNVMWLCCYDVAIIVLTGDNSRNVQSILQLYLLLYLFCDAVTLLIYGKFNANLSVIVKKCCLFRVRFIFQCVICALNCTLKKHICMCSCHQFCISSLQSTDHFKLNCVAYCYYR